MQSRGIAAAPPPPPPQALRHRRLLLLPQLVLLPRLATGRPRAAAACRPGPLRLRTSARRTRIPAVLRLLQLRAEIRCLRTVLQPDAIVGRRKTPPTATWLRANPNPLAGSPSALPKDGKRAGDRDAAARSGDRAGAHQAGSGSGRSGPRWQRQRHGTWGQHQQNFHTCKCPSSRMQQRGQTSRFDNSCRAAASRGLHRAVTGALAGRLAAHPVVFFLTFEHGRGCVVAVMARMLRSSTSSTTHALLRVAGGLRTC